MDFLSSISGTVFRIFMLFEKEKASVEYSCNIVQSSEKSEISKVRS